MKTQKPAQKGVSGVNSFGIFFSEPTGKTCVILVIDKQPFKIQDSGGNSFTNLSLH